MTTKATHTLTFEDHRSGGYMILTERGIPIAQVDCREDAALFAAAPALVAACEACIDALDENERHMVTLGGHLTYLQTSARNRARAALALVEKGGQS